MEKAESDIMRKYVQISLIPDEVSGITLPVLMSHVVQALHNLFVQIKDNRGSVSYGLSFPGYDEQKPTLGNQVRVHGLEKDLHSLGLSNALDPLQDYVELSSPRQVPAAKQKGYVAYSRLRHDHGKEKLIKRRMKRHGVTREKAEEFYADYQQNYFPEYPFVMMRSASTGSQQYPLYLKRVFLDTQGEGKFNTFGINPSAGVERF